MSFWPVTKRVIKESDVVIIVQDARMPELSRNRDLERKIDFQRKKYIRVYNKIDLISDSFLNKIKEKHSLDLFVSGKTGRGIEELRARILKIADSFGIEEIRVGIVGYPNMGKSSIINALIGKQKVRASKMPGTTKEIEMIKSGRILVLDSPGVVPLKDGEGKLSVLGSKNPERLRSPEKAAVMILEEFIRNHAESLEKFYDVKSTSDAYETFLIIGEKKKLLLKGAKVDERRTAFLILRDWQTGKLRF